MALVLEFELGFALGSSLVLASGSSLVLASGSSLVLVSGSSLALALGSSWVFVSLASGMVALLGLLLELEWVCRWEALLEIASVISLFVWMGLGSVYEWEPLSAFSWATELVLKLASSCWHAWVEV